MSELSIGPQYTEQTDTAGLTTQETDTWGISYNGILDWWATEQTKLEFGLSRSTEPSGVGNTVERDRASFAIFYRAAELVDLKFKSYYQQDNRVGNLGGLDRDYFTAIPSLHWQFARNWEFSTGYRYRWQQYDGLDTANSNMAFISVSVKTSGWNFAD
jgi:hypothetical protein